jgi:hypothetical protein
MEACGYFPHAFLLVMYIVRAMLVWIVIIIAESLNGTLREVFLVPPFGDRVAKQIGFFIGVAIIFSVTYAFIRWINAPSTWSLFGIGLIWMTLTVVFEFGLGNMLGYPTERMLQDYDLSRGGLMGFGLVFLFIVPWLAARVKGLKISQLDR